MRTLLILCLFGSALALAASPDQSNEVDLTVRETPIAKDGKRYIKLEVGGKTFLLELLRQDPNSPDAYRCVSHDGKRAVDGTYLVTGNARVTDRSSAFVSAIREKCEGELVVAVPSLRDVKLGLKWEDRKKQERQIYTQPLAPAPNVGFGMQF